MPIIMYDLACSQTGRRPCPFCWRARMAIAHKGLELDTVPWYFTKKALLPTPNDGRVPVIVDGARVVHDSWAIAEYLDRQYPDLPLLIKDDTERVLCRFLQYWSETAVLRPVMQMIAVEATNLLVPEDQQYFRATREARFGATFEDLVKDREARLPELRASFDPLRRSLERRNFIAGNTPAYADYIVFGIFQWARIVSDFEVLASDDPIRAWRGRMLDLFGGLARQTPAYGN